jgi:preprotein translocase subunit SecB
MKNQKNEPIVEFQIKGIELIKFSLIPPLQPLSKQTTFQFNIQLEQKIDVEQKLVIVFTTIDISNKDDNTQLASLTVSCIFEVANINEFVNDSSKLVTIPEEVLITFNSICISTLRGVMFSNLKGTFLHNAILPVVNPATFVKNNIQ